ncbi:hypothetical protein [Paraburkholderia sp.]|nr:hypothetical protein [Paraburkholderia sp.]
MIEQDYSKIWKKRFIEVKYSGGASCGSASNAGCAGPVAGVRADF